MALRGRTSASGAIVVLAVLPPADRLLATMPLGGFRQHDGSVRPEMPNGMQYAERLCDLQQIQGRQVVEHFGEGEGERHRRLESVVQSVRTTFVVSVWCDVIVDDYWIERFVVSLRQMK